MNDNNNKQQLANLRAELVERTTKASTSQERKGELTQSISRMVGEQALDGVDHSARIASAKAELALVEGYLNTWPDVQAELNRRVGEAEQALNAERLETAKARYTVLADLEAQQRREFANQVVSLAELSKRLLATISERDGLYAATHQQGGLAIPPGGRPTNYPPQFRPEWVQYGQPNAAVETLKDLL